MKVDKLTIYPIKGVGGYSPKSAITLSRGFENDRRWMLVDNKGKFISQREYPHLAQWKAQIKESNLLVSTYEDPAQFHIIENAQPSGQPNVEVTIWKDKLLACLVHLEADKLMSDLLKIECRLVYMNQETHRQIEPGYGKENTEVSFADGYPYLIATTASIYNLSKLHGSPIDINRFRPNIVIDNEIAWEEDGWENLIIGENHFELPKPCARCQVPGINQSTGVVDNTIIKSLAAHRRKGNKTLFGMNGCLIGDPGVIKVGDEVSLN